MAATTRKSAERKRLEQKLQVLVQDIDYYERVKKTTDEHLEALNREKRQVEMVLARIP